MFSAVKAVLLSAWPYPQPDRLAQLWQTNEHGHLMHVSGADFRDWRAQNRSLKAMASYEAVESALSGDFRPRHIAMSPVSMDFFVVVGTEAAAGRTFTAAEQKPGVVLSEGGALVMGGTILGLGCALFLTRSLESLLYGVGASDPGVFGAVAMLGCYLPAGRAARIHPNVALRYE